MEQWQGTSSGLQPWMLGENQQGQFWTCGETSEWRYIMHITLSICLCPGKPPSLSEKTCFLPIRTGLPACVRAGCLIEVLLNRACSAVRCCFSRSRSVTHVSAYIHLVARCDSRGSAASALGHPFTSRDPMFSCSVGEKVQNKPQTLLLASIKPPWKFKAFHKV